MNGLRVIFLFSFIGALGCRESPPFRVVPPTALRTNYLIDFEHIYDSTTLFIYSGHLLVFNPGERDAELTVTAYYEDREPDQFRLQAPAGASTESNPLGWPIRRGGYFALKIESDQPVICQATLGWANTGGELFWGAPTKNGSKVRETAKSYMAIQTLARHWYVADAVVIRDGMRHTALKWLPNATPHTLWIRESEWAVMLNPGDQPAEVAVALHYGVDSQEQIVTIPPRRLKRLYMDDIARPNRHYGVAVTSDRDIAVQWLRLVKWHDSPEPMSMWSVPAVPLDR